MSLGVIWRTWVALAVLVLLGAGVNVAGLAPHAAAGAALDAFTAVNASVFFALVRGVILGSEYPLRLIGSVVGRRRLLGSHGCTAGLAGVITAWVFGAVAAAVALPLLHARGMPAWGAEALIAVFRRRSRARADLPECAGATCWYVVMTVANLRTLATSLSPGSLVSSYFDNRIRKAVYDAGAAAAFLDAAREDGDAVIGQLGDDELTLIVEFVAGQAELDAYVDELRRGAPVFYGHVPAADNDAKRHHLRAP